MLTLPIQMSSERSMRGTSPSPRRRSVVAADRSYLLSAQGGPDVVSTRSDKEEQRFDVPGRTDAVGVQAREVDLDAGDGDERSARRLTEGHGDADVGSLGQEDLGRGCRRGERARQRGQ